MTSARESLVAARSRYAELGMVPIMAALLLIWAVFGLIKPAFLSSENLVNLTLQSASIGIIALGVVLVLLVGQIDLSVGSVSGLSAAVIAVVSVQWGWPIAVAILLALGVGMAIGLLYGMLATRLGLSSFVFTLAGLLVFAGVQWRVLGPQGSVNLPFETWFVRFSQQGFVPPAAAWVLVSAVTVLVSAVQLVDRARRDRAGLPVMSLAAVAGRVGVLATVLAAAVTYLGAGRGVAYIVVVFVSLVVVIEVLLRRTRWGRAMRAVGGNQESARRAGVPVRRTVISAFVACSTLAALGGIVAAGRLAAANQGTGTTETVLTAIAAAVIGGTSLFGGRGSAWSALLGVLVIQSIANGLTLLDMDTSMRYIVTGVVLVLAVTIDTLIRGDHRLLTRASGSMTPAMTR